MLGLWVVVSSWTWVDPQRGWLLRVELPGESTYFSSPQWMTRVTPAVVGIWGHFLTEHVHR